MKVSQVRSYETNVPIQKTKQESINFRAKVDFVVGETLRRSLEYHSKETQKALLKTLGETQKHFKAMGSDFLNIQMGIKNFLSVGDHGTQDFCIWASFKPMKEAKEYLLKNYGYALTKSQEKSVRNEEKNVFKPLEFGEMIYSRTLIAPSMDGYGLIKYADENFDKNIEEIKSQYSLESGEGKIFKDIVKHNTGLLGMIRRFYLS